MKKQKLKIKENMTNNRTIIDYYKLVDKDKFRFDMLRFVAEYKEDVVAIFIDTNYSKKNVNIDNIIDYLVKNNIEYKETFKKIAATSILGLKVKSQNRLSTIHKVLSFEINKEQITNDFYMECLSKSDFFVGINKKIPLDDIHDIYKDMKEEVAYNTKYFSYSMYNSITCLSVQLNINHEDIIKTIEDEIYL